MLNVQLGFLRLHHHFYRKVKNPIIETIEYLGFAALSGVVKSFSYRTASTVGSRLGGMAYRLLGSRKTVALDNLANAFPELSDRERESIALGAFRNYGIALSQMLWTGGKSEQELMATVSLANPEVIQHLLASPRGFILLSAHFGNWEFLPQGLRLHLGRPMTMIAQRQRNKRIDAMIEQARTRWNNKTVSMGVSSREAFRALQDGAMMLILGDQSGPKEAVFIDFFGRPAATHRGAAAFSLKTKTPIIMTLMVRTNDGTYETVFEEIDKTGIEEYSEENVVELTRRHTAVLEKHIRLHPDHWLWMHKRWKHTEYYRSTQLVPEGA